MSTFLVPFSIFHTDSNARQIFPRSIYTNDAVGVRSVGAIMRQQAKAKHAACAASVPPAEAS